MQSQSRMEKRLRKVQSRFYPGDLMTRNLRSVMAEISPTRVVYPDNRPIQGYRRHFVKGAKPLGRARGQTNGDAFTMPKHARCCVGFCDNDKRFPNLVVVRSHVKELKFHRWPKDPNLAELWRKQVAKGRSDNFNPEPGSEGTFVCSNHFPEGTRTRHNPSTDYPSVFLTLSDFLNKPSPCVFITWIKLMSKELSVLIIWPSKQQVKNTLPACFKKLYPKVRCIIDCFECFTETPSGLNLAAALWSECKHHYTCKVLLAITPTGEISYVSQSYGGRASDAFIVRDCGFLNIIEPYDEVMADRGFKIKEDLMMSMATLCIPPSCTASMQMLPSDVRKTSNIANVRIYVEQAIGRVKRFHILKNELPITLLPLVDDIVRVCCALCNLLPPLCE